MDFENISALQEDLVKAAQEGMRLKKQKVLNQEAERAIRSAIPLLKQGYSETKITLLHYGPQHIQAGKDFKFMEDSIPGVVFNAIERMTMFRVIVDKRTSSSGSLLLSWNAEEMEKAYAKAA